MIFKSTLIYTISSLFTRTVFFLLLPFYSNIFTREEFGVYSIFAAFYAFLAVIVQLGLHSGLTKYYVEEKSIQQKNIIVSTSINLSLVISFILAIFLNIFANDLSIFLFKSDLYSNYFFLFSIVLVCENFTQYFLQVYKIESKSKKVLFYSFVYSLLFLVSNIIFIKYVEMGVRGIFLAQIISNLILIILMIKKIKKNYTLLVLVKNPLFIKLFLFSVPFLISGFFSILIDVIDRFLINKMLGIAEVGIYSFGYKISLLMSIAIVAFRTAYNPFICGFLSENDLHKANRALLEKILHKYIFYGLSLIILVILLVGYLFKIPLPGGLFLFDQRFQPALAIVPFIMLGYFFQGLTAFYSGYVFCTGKSYHFIFMDLIGCAVNIFLNLWLIPKVGIIGASIATMVSFIVTCCYIYIVSYKNFPVRFNIKNLFFPVFGFLLLLFSSIHLKSILLNAVFFIIFLYINIKINKINNNG